MKAYITKYALSKGIFEIEAERSSIPDLIRTNSRGFFETFQREGINWHLSKDGAIEQAKRMRDNRIKALNKQIQKLNKLTFE